MDIKAQIESMIVKVTGDEAVKEKFEKDPMGTVRGFVGDAADNETVKKIVDAVKAALIGGKLGGLGEKIAGLLGIQKEDEAAAESVSEEKPEDNGGGIGGMLSGLSGAGGIGGMLDGLFGGKKEAEEKKEEE